jgi:hypothetical protein
MNTNLHSKSTLMLATLLCLPSAFAASMTQAEFSAGQTRIGAELKADKVACDRLAGNTKDICVEEAKAKDKIGLAELTANYSGTAADQNKLLVARAEAAYAVAKEKCDDQAGNAKDVCVKEAKAVETKALADAKMGKQISAARSDAASDKRDADYKLAVEKCDVLAGDAKTSCVNAAKSQYGKM